MAPFSRITTRFYNKLRTASNVLYRMRNLTWSIHTHLDPMKNEDEIYDQKIIT